MVLGKNKWRKFVLSIPSECPSVQMLLHLLLQLASQYTDMDKYLCFGMIEK